MYRMFRTLPQLGMVCTLTALAVACNRAPSAPTPTEAGPAPNGEAAADGSTLKVLAPTIISPTNDLTLDTRQPTLVVANTTGRFANRTFTYEFQLLSDSGSVIRTQMMPQGATNTSWVYPEQLERDTPYRWRVRARLNEAFGPWTSSSRFITVKEKRAADPPPGQRLPFPNWGAAIVVQVASQRPDLLRRSCQDDGGTWEFLDLVVDTLRLEDSRFGYNCKRGNCNDPSKDIVAYHYGPGPDQNSQDVYIIDTLLSHCGANPSPTWIDQTAITINSGTIGRWTSRGRF